MRTLTVDLTKDTGDAGIVYPGVAAGWRVIDLRGTFGHPVFLRPHESSAFVRVRIGDVYRGPVSSLVVVCRSGGTTQGTLLLQVFDRCEEWDAGSFVGLPAPWHEGRRASAVFGVLAGQAVQIQVPGPGLGQQNVYCVVIRRLYAFHPPVGGGVIQLEWGTGSPFAYPGNLTPVALESPAPPVYTAANQGNVVVPTNVMGACSFAASADPWTQEVEIPLWTIPGFSAGLSFIVGETTAVNHTIGIEFEEFGPL